ncbi:MAG: molybdopterin-dependent oxidoreductase [Desulfomonilaceae bacterium]
MNGMLDYHPIRRLNGTQREHDRIVTTMCRECAVGCGLCAYVCEGRLVDVHGDEKDLVSTGTLCAAGTNFVRDLYSSERIAKPRARNVPNEDFGDLESWDHALDLLADRLKKIRDQHGPTSLFIQCDPGAGLDFVSAAKRFAALWGTPYVFSSADDSHGSHPADFLNAPDCSCFDWIHSRCLLIVGADPASTHPVAFRWVLEAQKNGAKVVVADTRFTKTMSKADMVLRIRPVSGNFLGMGLMKVILDHDLRAPDSVSNQFTVADSWEKSFERISLEAAADRIGVSCKELKETAFLLANAGPVQLITGRPLASSSGHGIWPTMSAAMGWTGKKGGGWYPLDAGQPPLSASADLEVAVSKETGQNPEADSSVSLDDFVAKVTSSQVDPPQAIICSGNHLDNFLGRLAERKVDTPLMAYFGPVANRAEQASHIVFPAQTWAERDDLFFTNDGAIRWGRKIVEPPCEARSGLDFWIGLARRFQWDDRFPWQSEDGSADPVAFFDWLLDQNPATKGCTIETLRNASDKGDFVYWPFDRNRSGRTPSTPRLEPTEETPLALSPELEDLSRGSEEPYPLYLEVPDAVSRAEFCPGREALKNGRVLQINPETANALGIQTGDEVSVQGPDAIVEARAWLTRMVPRWLVYLQQGPKQKKVFVRRKGQSSQEALNILKELLP